MDRLDEIEERAATMTRDGLLTLLRAWGWSLRGQANGGALDIWEKGRATVHLPNLADAADYDECLQQAEWALATAEGQRLLAVVREVEALHVRRVERPNAGCLQCGQIWPCRTAAAVQKLGEGS
jgi:hypothetical protein